MTRLAREALVVAGGAVVLIALSATVGLGGAQRASAASEAPSAAKAWTPTFSTLLDPLLSYLPEPYGWGWER